MEIGSMKLTLPAGYETRGSTIAHLIGDRLASYQPRDSRQVATLQIRPPHIEAGAGDDAVADVVARAIIDALEEAPR